MYYMQFWGLFSRKIMELFQVGGYLTWDRGSAAKIEKENFDSAFYRSQNIEEEMVWTTNFARELGCKSEIQQDKYNANTNTDGDIRTHMYITCVTISFDLSPFLRSFWPLFPFHHPNSEPPVTWVVKIVCGEWWPVKKYSDNFHWVKWLMLNCA